jgi:hypothetical protein
MAAVGFSVRRSTDSQSALKTKKAGFVSRFGRTVANAQKQDRKKFMGLARLAIQFHCFFVAWAGGPERTRKQALLGPER